MVRVYFKMKKVFSLQVLVLYLLFGVMGDTFSRASSDCFRRAIGEALSRKSDRNDTERSTSFDYIKKLLYDTPFEGRTASDAIVIKKIKNDPRFRQWLDTQTGLLDSETLLKKYSDLGVMAFFRQKLKLVSESKTVDLSDYSGERAWVDQKRRELLEERKEDLQNAGADEAEKKRIESEIDKKLYNRFGYSHFFQKKELNTYEAKVLSLKPGDVVKFAKRKVTLREVLDAPNSTLIIDGQEITPKDFQGKTYLLLGTQIFKLGDYLGAGNATQIFEIEGKPDRVLRIPFLPQAIKEICLESTFHPDSCNKEFKKGMLAGITNVIEILEEGYGYWVVSRVDGNENGIHFFESVIGKKNVDPRNIFIDTEQWMEENKAKLDPSTFQKLQKLFDAMIEYDSIVQKSKQGRYFKKTMFNMSMASQWVWEPKKARWVLVDFD